MRNLKQNMQLKSAKHSKTQVSESYQKYNKPFTAKQQKLNNKTSK